MLDFVLLAKIVLQLLCNLGDESICPGGKINGSHLFITKRTPAIQPMKMALKIGVKPPAVIIDEKLTIIRSFLNHFT